MSTPDAKNENRPENAPETGTPTGTESALGSGPAPAAELAPEKQPADEAAAAWPPKEAAPVDESSPGTAAATTTAPAAEKPAGEKPAAEKPAGDKPVADKPAAEKPVAAADSADVPAAALPREEMPFSNSTLHWLEDGEVTGTGQSRITETITTPSFDPTAPVAGRRRAIVVVGGAGIVALLIAGALYVQAENRRAAVAPAPVVADPARELTTRAEAALEANKVSEALDLARLALVADPRSADAHFVVANCERARNQLEAARDEYRRYLALAPLGTHAAEARGSLASLPP